MKYTPAPHSALQTITDIGDSSVLGAMVIIGGLYLILCRHDREAIAVILAFVLAGSLSALLKIVFIACGHDGLHIASPSGHTALSIAVLGTFGLLIRNSFSGWKSTVIPAALFSLAILIATSRAALHFHTAAEVILGVLTGSFSLFVIKSCVLNRSHSSVSGSGIPFNIYILIALIAVAGFSVYGQRWPAEKVIGRFAQQLKEKLNLCPQRPERIP